MTILLLDVISIDCGFSVCLCLILALLVFCCILMLFGCLLVFFVCLFGSCRCACGLFCGLNWLYVLLDLILWFTFGDCVDMCLRVVFVLFCLMDICDLHWFEWFFMFCLIWGVDWIVVFSMLLIVLLEFYSLLLLSLFVLNGALFVCCFFYCVYSLIFVFLDRWFCNVCYLIICCYCFNVLLYCLCCLC